jgi:AcrR family transcriptional regulator
VPKDTFFNLPEDKRTLICDVALDEFAEYPFDQASINRIVANSGIAKGSFYQYFEDKKDLFLYLMGLIGEEKINYLSPVVRNPDKHDIFSLIKELYISGIQFATEHPRYVAIGNNLLANKEAPIYRELMADNLPSVYAFFEPLLEKAVVRGEVRTDIDIKMLNYVIASMNVVVVEYCSEINPQAIHKSMIETVDAFMDILKNGIGDNN